VATLGNSKGIYSENKSHLIEILAKEKEVKTRLLIENKEKDMIKDRKKDILKRTNSASGNRFK
jgi:hypothetical protein